MKLSELVLCIGIAVGASGCDKTPENRIGQIKKIGGEVATIVDQSQSAKNQSPLTLRAEKELSSIPQSVSIPLTEQAYDAGKKAGIMAAIARSGADLDTAFGAYLRDGVIPVTHSIAAAFQEGYYRGYKSIQMQYTTPPPAML